MLNIIVLYESTSSSFLAILQNQTSTKPIMTLITDNTQIIQYQVKLTTNLIQHLNFNNTCWSMCNNIKKNKMACQFLMILQLWVPNYLSLMADWCLEQILSTFRYMSKNFGCLLRLNISFPYENCSDKFIEIFKGRKR